MSDYSDGQGICVTESRVFAGDIVSRVFVGDTVSRAYMDAALGEARRRVAELSNETISGSDLVGGDHDGEGRASAAVSPNVHRRLDWSRLTGQKPAGCAP